MTNTKRSRSAKEYWGEMTPEWKAAAADLVAKLTKVEPETNCVEGPRHVLGALMALFGYNPKYYDREDRLYLTDAKWVLLGLRAAKTPAPSIKEVLGL